VITDNLLFKADDLLRLVGEENAAVSSLSNSEKAAAPSDALLGA
jgi:hypothetical protein